MIDKYLCTECYTELIPSNDEYICSNGCNSIFSRSSIENEQYEIIKEDIEF